MFLEFLDRLTNSIRNQEHRNHNHHSNNKERISYIDSFDTSDFTDGRLVQLTDETPQYRTITDKFFSISHPAAVLKRKVRYCQGFGRWVPPEAYHTTNKVLENTFIGSVKIGEYSIDSRFFNSSLAQTLLIPNYDQLSHFVTSDGQRTFRYIGHGYFYSEKKPGESDILRYDLHETNGKMEEHRIKRLLETCSPGDRFVQFYVYNPSTMTIKGLREGTRIRRIL